MCKLRGRNAVREKGGLSLGVNPERILQNYLPHDNEYDHGHYDERKRLHMEPTLP